MRIEAERIMALILAGIIMFGGSIVQGTIGFALGMIAVPLLVEAGFSLSQAVALTTLSIGIQVMFGAWKLRAHIPWDDVKPAAIVRYLTVAIGVLLLLSVENMSAQEVKRLVGIGVLLGVGLRIAAGQLVQRDWPVAASIAAFSISGVSARLGGDGRSAACFVDDHARLPGSRSPRLHYDTIPVQCAGARFAPAIPFADNEPRCHINGRRLIAFDLPRHGDRHPRW